MSWLRRLLGDRTPPDFPGALAPGEEVVDSAPVEGGGHLLVTALGLWIPDGDGARRVGWHLVAKAAWKDGVFTLTESSEAGKAGSAVVLADLAPVSYRLPSPGKVSCSRTCIAATKTRGRGSWVRSSSRVSTSRGWLIHTNCAHVMSTGQCRATEVRRSFGCSCRRGRNPAGSLPQCG